MNCSCTHADPWRCARANNLTTITCYCQCHDNRIVTTPAPNEAEKERPHADPREGNWGKSDIAQRQQLVEAIRLLEASAAPFDKACQLLRGGVLVKFIALQEENARLTSKLAEMESECAELRKHLRNANRGAETNAHVNVSLAKKLAELRQELEKLRGEG